MPLVFGILAFVYSGHGVFPSVRASMKQPEDFPKVVQQGTHQAVTDGMPESGLIRGLKGRTETVWVWANLMAVESLGRLTRNVVCTGSTGTVRPKLHSGLCLRCTVWCIMLRSALGCRC